MLQKIQEDNLPLFLIWDNETQCYFINNELIIDGIGSWEYSYPFRAFELLIKLYQNANARKGIPKRFYSYLKLTTPHPNTAQYPCLIGEIAEEPDYHALFDFHTVYLDLAFRDDLPTEIQFTDITYRFRKCVIPFSSFTVSAEEAFSLLANILANTFFGSDIPALKQYQSYSQVPKSIINEYTSQSSWKHYDDSYLPMINFSLEYLFYLQECLLAQSLTPYEIAFYDGIRTLSSLSYLPIVQEFTYSILHKVEANHPFTQNELAVSFCFLNALSHYSSHGFGSKIIDNPSFIFLKERHFNSTSAYHSKFPLK